MTIQIGDASANAVFTDVVQQSQSLAALNATNTVQLRGQSTATIQVTAIGSQTLTFEASTDGTNFTVISVWPVTNSGVPVTTTTTTGHWQVVVAGFYQFRVRCSAYTSGAATVSIVAAQGTNEQQVNVGVAIASTTAGSIGPLVQGAVTTAAPTYTTAQTNPLSLTTTGGVRVAVQGNAGAIFDGATAAAVPANALLGGARGMNANPTSVTNGQMVALAADLSGRIITTPLNYRTLISHTGVTLAVNTISTLVAAGAAGVFRDITQIVITTAGAAAQTITITDGTVSFILDYPNATLAPSTPLVLSFTDVPLRATTAATAWQVTQSLATTCHYLVQYVERIA